MYLTGQIYIYSNWNVNKHSKLSVIPNSVKSKDLYSGNITTVGAEFGAVAPHLSGFGHTVLLSKQEWLK